MEPDFQEWKTKNPNGTLNEYYAKSGVKAVSIRPQSLIVEIPVSAPLEKYNMINIVLGISISILGFAGYFTEWFKIPVFNIGISGNEINQLSNFLKTYNDNYESNFIQYSILIPICSFLIFLGTVLRSFMLTFLPMIINILIVGYIMCKLYFELSNLLSFAGIGLYLLAASSILTIVNFFTFKS